MKVYVVTKSDCENTTIEAVYLDEALAKRHADEMDCWVKCVEVLEAIDPAVIDPALCEERARERAEAVQQWKERNERAAADAKLRAEARPRPPHMNLCHCQTFSTDSGFINAHGYCGYCGGFTPEVFLEHMGAAALQAKIGELDIWRRQKMQELCARIMRTQSRTGDEPRR